LREVHLITVAGADVILDALEAPAIALSVEIDQRIVTAG